LYSNPKKTQGAKREQLLLQNLLENLFHDRPKKPREHKTGATKGQAVSEQQVIDIQCG
jgi:hypothetical protein